VKVLRKRKEEEEEEEEEEEKKWPAQKEDSSMRPCRDAYARF
jgi:hypothetical protein